MQDDLSIHSKPSPCVTSAFDSLLSVEALLILHVPYRTVRIIRKQSRLPVLSCGDDHVLFMQSENCRHETMELSHHSDVMRLLRSVKTIRCFLKRLCCLGLCTRERMHAPPSGSMLRVFFVVCAPRMESSRTEKEG